MTSPAPAVLRYAFRPSDRPCVVVVEDDAALLGALKFSLEAEGYDVRAFANQMDVIASQDLASSTSCLIMDYRLRPLNGLELFAILQSRGLRAPAILITSSPDEHCTAEAARLGVEVVEKPLLTDALSRRVGDLIAAQSLH